MSVSLGILGQPRVTVTVPSEQCDSIQTMRAATRRFASQGARVVTLVPRRDGEGWKKQKGTE